MHVVNFKANESIELGAHPSFKPTLTKRERHGKGQIVPPENAHQVLISRKSIFITCWSYWSSVYSTINYATGIIDNSSTGNNYITSSFSYFTWKASSDNEYNLINVVWEHYATIIAKLFRKRSRGKKLLYGQVYEKMTISGDGSTLMGSSHRQEMINS